MGKTLALFSVMLGMSLGYLSAPCESQTLADAAREARENKQPANKSNASHKVYTNESMNAARSEDTDAGEAKPTDKKSSGAEVKKTTALQWKAAIALQKTKVDALQSQIEKAGKTIQFVTANGYSNGPEYSAEQKRRMDRVEIAKRKLEQEKQKLEDMKESARKAGFGSAVYDP